MKKVPSVGEVLNLANEMIHEFLQEHNSSFKRPLVITLIDSMHKRFPISDDEDFRWDDSLYAWTHFDSISGGTDSYFQSCDELDLELTIWRSLYKVHPNPQKTKKANKAE